MTDTPTHPSPRELTSRILAEILVRSGRFAEVRMRAALADARTAGVPLGEWLDGIGWIGTEDLARLVADALRLPYLDPDAVLPSPDAVRLVDESFARERRLIPLATGHGRVRVALAEPFDPDVLRDIRFELGCEVEPVVISPAALATALERAFGGEADRLAAEVGTARSPEPGPWEAAARATHAAPLVRLVDRLLDEAVSAGASDVHIEPAEDRVRVRVRIDGILRELHALPMTTHEALLSRIKVMAGMDIAVRRRPQDGGLSLRHVDRDLRLRVSTLPSADGEKAVVRILDPAQVPAGLDAVGLAPSDLAALRRQLGRREGVILVTGPTGSGKSSTLHAALHELDRDALNVVTLEDPVEYRIPGVTQVQVQPQAGLTFPAGLRAVLRQDPDVVMVGEIRDRETAEIAMAAAVTGHLVLSTLHTNDAPGAVTRLIHMGVPPYLVAAGLQTVVAQRLVRRLCPACRGRVGADSCRTCRGGFRGRTGIFQLLRINDEVRAAIVAGAPTGELRRLAVEAGMRSLAEDARRLVEAGETRMDEVARVAPTNRSPAPRSSTRRRRIRP